MNKTTLLQAAVWIAGSMGLDQERDRDEVFGYVNKYRNLLYSSYDDVKLFDEYQQCYKVCTFTHDCSGMECSTYKGITLADDMGGIEAAWQYLEPMVLRSRYREAHVGKIRHGIGSDMSLTPVAGTFPTERDLTQPSKLKLYAVSKADTGKTVVIRATDMDNNEITLQAKLKGDQQVILNKNVKCILHVRLPADQCGAIELFQENGYLLSRYGPNTLIPQYKRYSVSHSCSAPCILVQGTRVYRPIFDDEDVVELGDQLVIEDAGRYFRYGEDTLDPKELNRASLAKRSMFDLINGILARDRGHQQQDNSNARISRRPLLRSGRLPGYNRSSRR